MSWQLSNTVRDNIKEMVHQVTRRDLKEILHKFSDVLIYSDGIYADITSLQNMMGDYVVYDLVEVNHLLHTADKLACNDAYNTLKDLVFEIAMKLQPGITKHFTRGASGKDFMLLLNNETLNWECVKIRKEYPTIYPQPELFSLDKFVYEIVNAERQENPTDCPLYCYRKRIKVGSSYMETDSAVGSTYIDSDSDSIDG